MDKNKQPAKIPNNKQLGVRTEVKVEQKLFSGPIPSPAILEGYEHLVKGSAERIIRMAEEQSTHRRHIEKKVIESEVLNSRLGIIFAFIIAMTTILGGVWVMVNASAYGGAFVVAIGLGGVVSTFIVGTKSRRMEREEQRLQK